MVGTFKCKQIGSRVGAPAPPGAGLYTCIYVYTKVGKLSLLLSMCSAGNRESYVN